MFDTERAAHALRYPRIGLAYLLEKFVNFQAQKQYQLADWRVRPLPEDLFNYARADTHFLLYIYDCMRNELIKNSKLSDPEGDLIQKVLDGSKGYQLQRYEHYIYDVERGSGAFGWYKQLYKTPALFSKQQFAVFKAVHQWRDAVARREDDSVHFIMNNHMLMSISRDMPDSKEKLASSANLFSGSMKQRADELVQVITKAKQEGLQGPEMRDVLAELDKLEDERKEKQWAARYAATIESHIKQQLTKSPQPTIAPKRPTAPDVGAVKAENSKFWGSTLSSKTQQRPITLDVRLALPLPELTAEVFSGEVPFTPDVKSGVQTPDAAVRPEHAYVPKAERAPLQPDDVFIIKQLGGRGKKRKASDAEVGDGATNNKDFAGNADELPLHIEEDEAAEKARRKSERRAAKKLKKQQKAQEFDAENYANGNGVSANGGQADEEPFDYANAPSVLHGGREEGKGKGKRKKRDRGIDPYAKALDAPKGLPRAQRERAGRSKTFTS
jgi:exosome complex exonuclease RRP6